MELLLVIAVCAVVFGLGFLVIYVCNKVVNQSGR
jgi:hypothetical protein